MSEHSDPKNPNGGLVRLLTIIVAAQAGFSILLLVGMGILVFMLVDRADDPNPQEPLASSAVKQADRDEQSGTQFAGLQVEQTTLAKALPELEPLPSELIAKEEGPAASWLAFDWTKHERFAYDFEITLKSPIGDEQISGRTTFKASEQPVDQWLASLDSKIGPDTGSGFVIHPDGLLVTCAHVVHGRQQVEVQLGEKKLVGKVAAVDESRDLALVRVNAKGLRYLSLGKQEVRLGEDIRVLGFPLTNTLGESIKITSGSISGKDVYQNTSRLQIDATVNPGNSGGPLIGHDGRVVGVASALLTGTQISDVAFAVKGQDLRRMLQGYQIPFREGPYVSDGGNSLAAKDLESACEAVALIRCDSRSSVATLLEASSSYTRSRKYAPTNTNGAVYHQRQRSDKYTASGVIAVTRHGQLVASDSDELLPIVFTSPITVGIEPLSSAGLLQWQQETPIMVMMETSNSRSETPVGLGRTLVLPSARRMVLGLFGGTQETVRTRSPVLGVQRDQYSLPANTADIVKSKSQKISIRKETQLLLDNQLSRDESDMTFEGIRSKAVGDIVFGPEQGIPVSFSSTGQLTFSFDRVAATGDVTFKYTYKSAEQLDAEAEKIRQAQQQAAMKKAEQERAEEAVKEILTPLKSPTIDKYDPNR